MAKRLISAAIAVPIGILIIWLSNVMLYTVVIAVLSVIATYEIFCATKYVKEKTLSVLSLTFVFCVPFMFVIPEVKQNVILIVFMFVVLLFVIMLRMHKTIKFEEIALVSSVSIAVPLALSTVPFLLMKFPQHGTFYIVYMLISAWIADAGAYFVGTFFGKHKMAPEISPKKTWEGFIGGVVTAAVFAVLLGIGYGMVDVYLHGRATFAVNIPYLVVLSIICAVLGVVGDLSASLLKRQCTVKDFGNILPGHGGVLDRFDSVLFVGPFVYLIFQIWEPISTVFGSF